MSSYTINSIGSSTCSTPSSLKVGDILTWNVTNTSTTTRYQGTIMSYTFPADCTAKLEAYGARGGYGNLYTYGVTNTSRSGYGAYCYGTFDFKKGDQILILVGQPGSDAMTGTSSTKDQTSGAGGGGTFIAKKVTSSSYLFNGSSNSNSTAYSGWYVEPLLVAAGGNGSRDNGYSGTGTIYDGQGFTSGTAEALGSTGTSNSYCTGGAFSKEAGSTSSNSSSYSYGRSFLNGGLGSMYYYTRSTTSYAGFGGGGSNRDDNYGGGGGGWVSGYNQASAKSYVNTSLATSYGSTAAASTGNGSFKITITKLSSLNMYVKVGGAWKEATNAYVKIGGVWKEITEVKSKISGTWK